LLDGLEGSLGAAPGVPDAKRREQEALRRVVASGVAEHRRVVARQQPIRAAVLLVGPPGRQVVA
jgi:hypothetical protein